MNDRSVSDDFNFLNSILNDEFLSYNWHFVRFFDDGIGLNDSFDDLWNLNKLFDSLNDWNRFFNNSVNDLISNFNVVLNLFRVSVLNFRNKYSIIF